MIKLHIGYIDGERNHQKAWLFDDNNKFITKISTKFGENNIYDISEIDDDKFSYKLYLEGEGSNYTVFCEKNANVLCVRLDKRKGRYKENGVAFLAGVKKTKLH